MFVQHFLYWLFYLPFRILFRLSIRGLDNFPNDNSQPVIFASNHPSRFDAFLFFLLPYQTFSHVSPLGIMVAEYYYQKIWLKPFLWMVGGYPVKNYGSSYDELLSESLGKLKQNQNLLIFPEGKITKHPDYIAKSGIAYLASESQISVLPIKFQGHQAMHWKKIISFPSEIELKIGEVIEIPKLHCRQEYKKHAVRILTQIYSL